MVSYGTVTANVPRPPADSAALLARYRGMQVSSNTRSRGFRSWAPSIRTSCCLSCWSAALVQAAAAACEARRPRSTAGVVRLDIGELLAQRRFSRLAAGAASGNKKNSAAAAASTTPSPPRPVCRLRYFVIAKPHERWAATATISGHSHRASRWPLEVRQIGGGGGVGRHRPR